MLSIGTSITASANPISNNVVANTTSQDKFSEVMGKIHKKNNAKVLSISDNYVKITNISKDPNKPNIQTKVYTKQQYLQEITKKNTANNTLTPSSVIATTSTSTSWIRLTLEFDDPGFSQRDVYGFYQWLTQPSIRGTDIISLGHDANISFDFQRNYADILYDYLDFGGCGTSDTHLTPSNTSNFVPDVGGIAYKFDLPQTNTYVPYNYNYGPYGLIYVRANAAASNSGPIVFTYAHEIYNISISPSVSIPMGGSLGFNFASDYSKQALANTLYFY